MMRSRLKLKLRLRLKLRRSKIIQSAARLIFMGGALTAFMGMQSAEGRMQN